MIHPAPSPILSLSMHKILRASPARVFRAWTEPDELRRWFAVADGYTTPIAEVDLRVGGRYRLGMKPPEAAQVLVATGRYQEITPPSRLVFTWRWEAADVSMPDTRVVLELHPHPQGTELTLTHEGFNNDGDRDQHAAGWEGCLNLLERRLSATQNEKDN